MNDEEDPFKGLEDDDVEEDPVQTLGTDLSILKERFADQIDADISLDEYVDFDIKGSTSHGKLAIAEIIAEVTGAQEDNSDEEESDNVEGEPIIKPEIEEVQKAIGILEDFSLYSKFGKAMMRSLKELNFNVEKEYAFNKKQILISDFFLNQQMVMLIMYICYDFDVFLLPYRLKLLLYLTKFLVQRKLLVQLT